MGAASADLRIAVADKLEPKIVITDAPDPADTAVIADSLRAYNTEQAGRDDSRALAIFATDALSGTMLGCSPPLVMT